MIENIASVAFLLSTIRIPAAPHLTTGGFPILLIFSPYSFRSLTLLIGLDTGCDPRSIEQSSTFYGDLFLDGIEVEALIDHAEEFFGVLIPESARCVLNPWGRHPMDDADVNLQSALPTVRMLGEVIEFFQRIRGS